MNVLSLVGATVPSDGERVEIIRILGSWHLADGRAGLTVALYLPWSERVVHARVCTTGGQLAVVDVPELDVIVLDARPIPLLPWRQTGGAA